MFTYNELFSILPQYLCLKMVVAKDVYINELCHTHLKDGTEVTVLPYNSLEECPEWLFQETFKLFNQVVAEGKTYPFEQELSKNEFISYYWSHFVGILVKGHIIDKKDFTGEFMGCFYIKSNYPGRSSHVCNGGFLVSYQHRSEGCGSVMGKTYVDWAPKLGFLSSVFNLVYASNITSCKIWEGLGFKQIGKVPACGRLEGQKELVDAIMYGYTF